MPFTVEDVARVGPDASFSPYGYLIREDGTILSLDRQYFHGVVCALLFPEIAKEAGIELPDTPDDCNVFDFQAFEHDNAYRMPVIRVATGGFLGGTYVSKSYAPATDAQIEGLRKCFVEMGLMRRGRKVVTEDGDFDAAKCLKDMREDESWREEFRDRESRLAARLKTRRAFEGDE